MSLLCRLCESLFYIMWKIQRIHRIFSKQIQFKVQHTAASTAYVHSLYYTYIYIYKHYYVSYVYSILFAKINTFLRIRHVQVEHTYIFSKWFMDIGFKDHGLEPRNAATAERPHFTSAIATLFRGTT